MPIHTDTLVDGMRLRVVDGVHELIATPRWSTSSFQPMVNLVSPNLLNVVLLPTEDQLSILRAAGTQSATSIDYFSRTIVVTEGMIADANLFDSVDGSPSAVSNWADRIRLGTFSGESVASNPAAAIADWNFDGIVDSVDVQDILPLLDAADLAADVDGSDFVDADDFIAFIAELTNGCRAPGLDGNGANSACLFGADVDASGFVDSDDLVYFVSRVFTS